MLTSPNSPKSSLHIPEWNDNSLCVIQDILELAFLDDAFASECIKNCEIFGALPMSQYIAITITATYPAAPQDLPPLSLQG